MAKQKRARPATTDEGRESQLGSLAIDVAEKQMVEGNVSSQVLTHFLKLASTREKLEQERLRNENELLKAKVKDIEARKEIAGLLVDALSAMKAYSGQDLDAMDQIGELDDEV